MKTLQAMLFLLVASHCRGFSLRGRVASRSFSRGSRRLMSLASLRTGQSDKVNVLDLNALKAYLKDIGQPAYRGKQIQEWLFKKGASSFDEMSNLPASLRQQLTEGASIGSLELVTEQVSKDGTRKRAYALRDGQVIESVLMPYSDGRRTACISSQAGCAMGCVFCATGQMGFARQMTGDEIFEQAFRFANELAAKGERLTNVVYMGMGEPLANYGNVLDSVKAINSKLGIGARHITISTVGLVPRIDRLADEGMEVKLAVSLHASNDKDRSQLLPVNRRFPLAELMASCRRFVDATSRRMTFEWALIHGENDSPRVAQELGALLSPLRGMCHVNIIPLNPTAGYRGGPAQSKSVNSFIAELTKAGISATPRVRRGIDIDAGCGQLKASVTKDQVLGKGL
ncbi:unnamed protein product [Chrysoparadoxa australica]